MLAAACACGGALAQSTYGLDVRQHHCHCTHQPSATVPKMILLKVGSADTTVDTLSWSVTQTIPAGAVTPVAGNNTGVNWTARHPR